MFRLNNVYHRMNIDYIFPPISQAQIDFLRKELSKKDTAKHERDTMAVMVTEVQQQLQQFEGKACISSGSSMQASND